MWHYMEGPALLPYDLLRLRPPLAAQIAANSRLTLPLLAHRVLLQPPAQTTSSCHGNKLQCFRHLCCPRQLPQPHACAASSCRSP